MSFGGARHALRHALFARSGIGYSKKHINFNQTASLYTGENAFMTATYGEPYPYSAPWPYEKKRLNPISELYDIALTRMNGNSKMIIVDGNVASGKNEFARQLARNFDLKYYPAINDSDLYKKEGNNFNMRALNDLLPKRSQFYDLGMWLQEEDKSIGRVGAAQLEMLELRFKQTCMALLHLLSTGQGVVMVRSPWSDFVFTKAMRRMNYVSKGFAEHYKYIADNSVCDLIKPHITIYLDIPPSDIMDRIRKRNAPGEVNSTTLTEEFVHTVEDVYKKEFIPQAKIYGEYLEYDGREFNEQIDYDAVAEVLQNLNLESFDCDDKKFEDWFQLDEDDMAMCRQIYHLPNPDVDELFNRAYPFDCPEILPDYADKQLYDTVVNKHPAIKYKNGAAPIFGNAMREMFSFR